MEKNYASHLESKKMEKMMHHIWNPENGKKLCITFGIQKNWKKQCITFGIQKMEKNYAPHLESRKNGKNYASHITFGIQKMCKHFLCITFVKKLHKSKYKLLKIKIFIIYIA